MNKILSFILASFLASSVLMLPGGSGGAYASNHCVKIKVDGKVVCVKGKRVKKGNQQSLKESVEFTRIDKVFFFIILLNNNYGFLVRLSIFYDHKMDDHYL